MAIERILSSDSGKIAFEKSDRNFTGLEQRINVLNNRTLAPALSNVISDTLFIGDEWTGISCVRTDHGTVNAPPNCTIGVRTMKKLNDDNVIVNVENTQNGEKWTNTWNGSTWLGWKQIATTTKTELSLLNGWENFFGTGEPATISRSGNIVTIKACLKNGTYTNGTVIFNIPTEFRPSKTQTVFVDVEDGTWVASRKFIGIYNDGRCVCNGIHSNVRVTIYVTYTI